MFPLLYHAHHNRHLEDLPFWLDLANRQGDPILELGCGSGRVFLPLAAAGHQIYGLDRDAGMLAVLHRHLSLELQDAARFWQADLTTFHLALEFALILLPCNTFSTLSTQERRSTLACVRRHLRPGGIFAASLPNPAMLRRLPPHADPEVEESFPHPLDGEPVQVSSEWARTPQELILHWHYDHLLPDGRVERLSVQARHSLNSAEEYQEELTKAGLQIVYTYGDYDRSIYSSSSPYLILIAQRSSVQF